MERKKNKTVLILLLPEILLCAGFGALMGEKIISLRALFSEMPLYLFLPAVFAATLAICRLSLLLHEAGHLLFGLLTGYRFLSFRIGNRMWVKEDGKIVRKKYSLAGTAGQCLLIPCEGKEEDVPFVLYHLGGVLLNAITAVLFLILSLNSRNPVMSAASAIVFFVNGLIAITNGIPYRGAVSNDGDNLRTMLKNPKARTAFVTVLRIHALLQQGKRLKDMNPEWFVPEKDYTDPLTSVMMVMYGNYLMDCGKLEEAYAWNRSILEEGRMKAPLYENLLKDDCVSLALLLEKEEDVTYFEEKELTAFNKSMKTYPSVLRTQYLYALLKEKNEEKAEEYRRKFEKTAESYPYSGELEGERELMAWMKK